MISIALVDDHKLFRKGLVTLLELACPECNIIFEADNGTDLIDKIKKNEAPEIILLDVNMPGMDGFATVQWLKDNYPQVKILVISMIEKEDAIVRMLKLGVKGYLCKDVEPQELRSAITAVHEKGFFYTDFITGRLVNSLQRGEGTDEIVHGGMNEQERKFLQLACSEMTYNQIAEKMFLSPKTIDGYRNSLFEKLNVKSRVGLVLYAVKNKIVSLD
jgi:two-component system, NarL family, invasion response regulator UvrY